MLSVQPKISNNYTPAFKAHEDSLDYSEININNMDEDTYESLKENLHKQKEDLLNVADNKEFKMLKPAKKIFEGGAIVTTGLLGGMATGWGTKKSIQAFSAIAKTAPMQSLKKQIKATTKFMKETSVNFKKSEAYTKPVNAIHKSFNKFAGTKLGKPIAIFFKTIAKGIKTVFNAIKNGIKYIFNKIKGVKKETYENGAVNFMGASGGIAAGGTALKEHNEAKDKE